MCLVTATHNFKWVKVTPIWLIWDQQNTNVEAHISFPITVIYSANKTRIKTIIAKYLVLKGAREMKLSR